MKEEFKQKIYDSVDNGSKTKIDVCQDICKSGDCFGINCQDCVLGDEIGPLLNLLKAN